MIRPKTRIIILLGLVLVYMGMFVVLMNFREPKAKKSEKLKSKREETIITGISVRNFLFALKAMLFLLQSLISAEKRQISLSLAVRR
jgi:hypothetical protein